MKTVLLAVLLGGGLGLLTAVCHEMNSRVNERFADKSRKLGAVREAVLEVNDAERDLKSVGHEEPAAVARLDVAWEALRRAEAVASADRFPRRPKSGAPSED
jgi:hypothetical protein